MSTIIDFLSNFWFPIMVGVVAAYMCHKYPTGEGRDPW